jgi:hypothetical protein
MSSFFRLTRLSVSYRLRETFTKFGFICSICLELFFVVAVKNITPIAMQTMMMMMIMMMMVMINHYSHVTQLDHGETIYTPDLFAVHPDLGQSAGGLRHLPLPSPGQSLTKEKTKDKKKGKLF